MSTIKTDAITAVSTNTDISVDGDGTGVPDLGAGMKVGGSVGIPVSELRTGTDGELITWDASGNPTTVAVGTSTHVLTSNGVGAAPTFQAAAGTFVEKVTCSGNATEELGEGNIEAGYIYRLHFLNVKPSADAHVLVLIGTGGGPTYLTSGYAGDGWRNTGSLGGYANPSTSVQLGSGAGGASAGETMNATMRIMNAAETVETKFYVNGTWQDSGGNESGFAMGAEQTGTAAVTGFQVKSASGNLASGDIVLAREKLS